MLDKEEYILCSAIWYPDLKLLKPEVLEPYGFRPYNIGKGVVFSGWRHANCVYQMVGVTGLREYNAGDKEEGFLTSKNRFVNREEAAKIAFERKQITKNIKTLYSEDLY